jgi:hypothetical protein
VCGGLAGGICEPAWLQTAATGSACGLPTCPECSSAAASPSACLHRPSRLPS